MSNGQVKILDGNTFVVSDDRGDIEASLDRSDRTVLLRHPVPLEVGAHHRRRAPERLVDRRPAVLREPLLPGSWHRHRLRGRRLSVIRQPVGGQRVPRAADDPEPRRRARGPRRAHRGGLRLRRPLRGQGRPEEEGFLPAVVEEECLVLRYRARDLRTGDVVSRPPATAAIDQNGIAFKVGLEATRAVDDASCT